MKIAIIGTGISGMTSAHLLSEEHELVVYETNSYVGGHTHTVDVSLNGKPYAVDTGFIVFNEKTYPNFIKLMKRLGVSWQKSVMSFSVQCEKTGLEFSPSSLNGLFIQRRNLLRPSFYRMLYDVSRFKKDSEKLLQTDDFSLTLATFLKERNYSKAFVQHFIIPMGEAVWSADPVKFDEFPARYFAQFFKNHGFLNVKNQAQWLTIKGRSRQYIQPIIKSYTSRIRLDCPIASIRRFPDHVEVQPQNEAPESFDQVVIAAHSDQALALLADPTDAEKNILGEIPYQENQTVLHSDESLLPCNKAAWASWNYHIPREDTGRVAVTYNMNILQRIGAPQELCVSLNLNHVIDPTRIYRKLIYHHPVYNPGSLKARQSHSEISGRNRTHYAGAYWGYGFHEDGVVSALKVCEKFGKSL